MNFLGFEVTNPAGPYTLLLWNQVPKTINEDGLLWPNSMIVVYMDPLGKETKRIFHNDSVKEQVRNNVWYSRTRSHVDLRVQGEGAQFRTLTLGNP